MQPIAIDVARCLLVIIVIIIINDKIEWRCHEKEPLSRGTVQWSLKTDKTTKRKSDWIGMSLKVVYKGGKFVYVLHWTHGWAVQKGLNRSRCRLGPTHMGPKTIIRWGSRFSWEGTFLWLFSPLKSMGSLCCGICSKRIIQF